MVINERNHPSLIAHGVRIDESVDDHYLYTETNKIAHELDPYRPTIGVRNFTNSELLEDIYGYNDFICDSLKQGLTNPKKVKHLDKALLVKIRRGPRVNIRLFLHSCNRWSSERRAKLACALPSRDRGRA